MNAIRTAHPTVVVDQASRGSSISEVIERIVYAKLAALPLGPLYFFRRAIQLQWAQGRHPEDEFEFYGSGVLSIGPGMELVPLQVALMIGILVTAKARLIRVPWLIVLVASVAAGPLALWVDLVVGQAGWPQRLHDLAMVVAPVLLVLAASCLALPRVRCESQGLIGSAFVATKKDQA